MAQPVRIYLPNGSRAELPPDTASVQMKHALEGFIRTHIQNWSLLYVAIDHSQPLYVDERLMAEIEMPTSNLDSAPEIIVYCHDREWLFLISVGGPDRYWSPERLQNIRPELDSWQYRAMYVSCFDSRHTMAAALDQIALDTDAWCTNEPDHIIYLGPGHRWQRVSRVR